MISKRSKDLLNKFHAMSLGNTIRQTNNSYVYISGVTNGIVFLETGDSEKFCDAIDCMLGVG